MSLRAHAFIFSARGFDMSPLFGRKSKRQGHSALHQRNSSNVVEHLEERRLLAVTVDWNSGTNKLTVTGTTGADELYVRGLPP